MEPTPNNSSAKHDSASETVNPLVTTHFSVPSARVSNVRVSERTEYSNEHPGLRVGASNFRHFKVTDLRFGAFCSKLYRPIESRVRIESAPAVVSSFHGLNATISHAGSSLAFLNDLVTNHGIYGETIDQPGCGNNLDFSVLDSLDGWIDFNASYLKNLRDRAGDKLIVPTTFCYTAGLLVEINKRNPGLIDGMVLSGLIIPDRAIGLDYSIAVESQMYLDGLIKENPAIRTRADRIYADLTWTGDDNPFDTVPTLILIGKNDPFQTEGARSLFRRWSERYPDTISYVEVDGAGHGVLGPIKDFPESTTKVRQEVLRLMERASERRKAT